MNDINRGNIVVPVLLLTMLLVSVPAFSQIERSPTTGVEQDLTQSTDFAGEWVVRNFEDQLERGLGPQLGDYLGIPFNAAGRMRAETFDAGEWSLPEFQCRPHPVPYQWRAQGAMRISDPLILCRNLVVGQFEL